MLGQCELNHCRVPATFMRFLYDFLCAVALTLLVVPSALADQVPLWEAGAGAVIDFTIAVRRRENYVLPIPYIIYRGDFSRLTARGAGSFFTVTARAGYREWFGAGQEQRARQGMPNLDPTFEIGPSLNIMLYQPNRTGRR